MSKWVSLDDYCLLYELSKAEFNELNAAGTIECRETKYGTIVKLPGKENKKNVCWKILAVLASVVEIVCSIHSSDKDDELLMYDDGISDLTYKDESGMTYERDISGKLRDEFGRKLD